MSAILEFIKEIPEILKKGQNDQKFPLAFGVALGLLVLGVSIITAIFIAIGNAFYVCKFKSVKLGFPVNKQQCLHIAEIEIYNGKEKVLLNESMIEMSSIYPGDNGDKLMIDGNDNTASHTNCGAGESITITFPTSQAISDIKIKNRKDCCQERIIGASLFLIKDDNKAISLEIKENKPVYNFVCKNETLSLQ
jgi:hypothetical protein